VRKELVYMFNGIEVDVLSLGDADCIAVTQWHDSFPHRILIDGGSGANAELVTDFLRSRDYTDLWAVLCTHPHNDHARGLIKVVQDKSITFRHAWMHDIRRHVSPDALRRAAAADSGVKEVVETTKELASVFASRSLTPQEPFAGTVIAGWPNITVLGPSLP
jgi:glyoxylase-like metal-dependent hydrolase (beta-lactamase superfamily II)